MKHCEHCHLVVDCWTTTHYPEQGSARNLQFTKYAGVWCYNCERVLTNADAADPDLA